MTKQTKKELILEIAREIFLEKGFDGASLNEIIAKADVTRSLLFHHFKNKEHLWQLVKSQVVEEGDALFENLPSVEQPLRSFLHAMIEFVSNFYKSNPDVVRIINWQRLIRDGDQNVGFAKIDLWLKVTEHFKNTGEISKDISSENVVIFTLSIMTSLALDRNALLDCPKKRESYVNFVVDNLMRSYVEN